MKIPVVDQGWEAYRKKLGNLIHSIEGDIDWNSVESLNAKLKYLKSQSFVDDNIRYEDRDYVVSTYFYIVKRIEETIQFISSKTELYRDTLRKYSEKRDLMVSETAKSEFRNTLGLDEEGNPTEYYELVSDIDVVTEKISTIDSRIAAIDAATAEVIATDLPGNEAIGTLGETWLLHVEDFITVHNHMKLGKKVYEKYKEKLSEVIDRLNILKAEQDAEKAALEAYKEDIKVTTDEIAAKLAVLPTSFNNIEQLPDLLSTITACEALLTVEKPITPEKYNQVPSFLEVQNDFNTSKNNLVPYIADLKMKAVELSRLATLKGQINKIKHILDAINVSLSENGKPIKPNHANFLKLKKIITASLSMLLDQRDETEKESDVEDIIKETETLTVDVFESVVKVYKKLDEENRSLVDVEFDNTVNAYDELYKHLSDVLYDMKDPEHTNPAFIPYWEKEYAKVLEMLNQNIAEKTVTFDEVDRFILENELTILNAKEKKNKLEALTFSNNINTDDSVYNLPAIENWDELEEIRTIKTNYRSRYEATRTKYDEYKTEAERLEEQYKVDLLAYTEKVKAYLADTVSEVNIDDATYISTAELQVIKNEITRSKAVEKPTIPEPYTNEEDFQLAYRSVEDRYNNLNAWESAVNDHLNVAAIYNTYVLHNNDFEEERLSDLTNYPKNTESLNTFSNNIATMTALAKKIEDSLVNNKEPMMKTIFGRNLAINVDDLFYRVKRYLNKVKSAREEMAEYIRQMNADYITYSNAINTSIQELLVGDKKVFTKINDKFALHEINILKYREASDIPTLTKIKEKIEEKKNTLLDLDIETTRSIYNKYINEDRFIVKNKERVNIVKVLDEAIAIIENRKILIEMQDDPSRSEEERIALIKQDKALVINNTKKEILSVLSEDNLPSLNIEENDSLEVKKHKYAVYMKELNNLYNSTLERIENIKAIDNGLLEKYRDPEAIDGLEAAVTPLLTLLSDKIAAETDKEEDYTALSETTISNIANLYRYFEQDIVVNDVEISDLMVLSPEEKAKLIALCRYEVTKIRTLGASIDEEIVDNPLLEESRKALSSKRTRLENTIAFLEGKDIRNSNNDLIKQFVDKVKDKQKELLDLNPFMYNFLEVDELNTLIANLNRLKEEINGISLNNDDLENKIKYYADLVVPENEVTNNLDITLSNYKNFVSASKTKVLLIETINDILNSSDVVLSNRREGVEALYNVWKENTETTTEEVTAIVEAIEPTPGVEATPATTEIEKITEEASIAIYEANLEDVSDLEI